LRKGVTDAGRHDQHEGVIGMSDRLNGNREPVRFCDADACGSCGFAEGVPQCLRRKAKFCFWLANRFPSAGLGTALRKLGLDLTKDADALARERVVFSNRDQAAT
jgi:hypothetical protein